MATEEQKKANQLRLANMIIYGLAVSVWDMVGESAYVFSKGMGDVILPVLEKEMGLEIAGESHLDVATEVGRIAVDELGIAKDMEITGDGDKIIMKLREYILRPLYDNLAAAGVEKPFVDPVMCIGEAVIRRLGKKPRINAEKWEEGKGVIITFELI